MSALRPLPKHWHPLRRLNPVHTCQIHAVTQIRASSTTTTTHKRQADLAVIEPPRVPPAPPLPATPHRPLPHDPSLQSTWTHRAWVTAGCTSVLVTLAKSISVSIGSENYIESVLAGILGYIVADLGTGIYHWGIDNYGDALTPVFGAQIEAFQGHHKWPWVITKRQFANNLHSLARAVTFALMPVNLAGNSEVADAFIGVCTGCIMFSQQFHAWAHSNKTRLPRLVVALQDAGVLVSRVKHGAHHRAPYNNNYCIVSGIWNTFLDDRQFFEAAEMIVFFKFGLRPRSWTEPEPNWVQETDTNL